MSILADILEWLGLLAQVAPVNVPAPLYGGLDNMSFPGQDFMRLLRPAAPAPRNTNLDWTGLYLSHSSHGTDATWTSQAIWLQNEGWGILPIYLGRQAPFTPPPPNGAADAAWALAQASTASLPAGSVIYLDWEENGPLNPANVTYIVSWCTAICEAGYRPGLYAFRVVALRARQEVPGLFVWVIHVINTASGIAPADPAHPTFLRWNLRGPSATDDPDAIACQYLQPWDDVAHKTIPNPAPPPPTLPHPDIPFHRWPVGPPAFAFPMPGLAGVHYGTTVNPHPPPQFQPAGLAFDTHGHPLFDIDISGSTVGNPLFPERRVQPSLVRAGSLTAAVVDAATLAMFAVRRGALAAGTWSTATPATTTSVTLPDHSLTCNPWSTNAGLRRGASGDLAIVARSSAAGTPDNAWQLHAYRRRGTTWTFDTNINGATPIEPLPGVRLVSRAANTVEAFFLTNDGTDRVFVVSCVDAATQADGQTWSAPIVVNAPVGMQPSLVGGIGAASHAAGTTDVFVVARRAAAQSCQLYWNSSSIVGTWPSFSVPGDPTITLHPFSNVVPISRGPNIVDVFAIGKGIHDANWMLYTWWWNHADSWGVAPNFHTQAIVGTTVRPHPTSKVAAASRSLQSIDVFIAGAVDGLLYTASWNGATNTWSDFSRVGTNAIRIASVDGAFSRAATAADVVVTGRDGNAYVSFWDAARARYADLTRIAAFDLA